MKRLIILVIIISAISFTIRNVSSYTLAQDLDITPKDALSTGSQTPNKYLLNAGRNLEIAAGLRYAGFGSGIASLALYQYGDKSDSDLGRILQYGSGILFVSPYYIGRAGKELAKANLNIQTKQAGTALQKYRSSYYGGLAMAVAGGGILAIRLYNEAELEEPSSIALAAVALVGFLYSSLAPPHYLGSAGSYLSKMDMPSDNVNLQMSKVGTHLKKAGAYQYSSFFAYLLGGVLTAYGISEDDDSSVLMGGFILGLGALSDLISTIRISCAGMGLNKASKM